MSTRPLLGEFKHGIRNHLRHYSTLVNAPIISRQKVVESNISMAEQAKMGQLVVARKMFDEMPKRTVVSWNTMVSAYSKWGNFSDAFSLVSSMHCQSNVRFNETTFCTILSVCAHTQSFLRGQQIHSFILKSGFERYEFVGSSLLYFYGKCLRIFDAKCVFNELRDENEVLWNLMLVGYVHCGLLDDAYDLFIEMPNKDVVSWTTLISGYAKSTDRYEKALYLYRMMRGCEVVPNEFTLDNVVRVCGRLGALIEGMSVHGILIKSGLVFDPSVGGALVAFYCDCEAINDAIRVYEKLVNPSLNASNSLILGFLLMGRIDDAEMLFYRMHEKDSISYNLMVKGYAMTGQIENSKRLFEKMPHKTLFSFNTMISVYSRNGEIGKALVLFEEIKGQRNPVTWNSILTGYVQNGRHEEALKLFVIMRRLLIDYTRSTFAVLLHACSCIGSLQQGKIVHGNLVKTPFEVNVYVGSSLVHMYSKCGSLFDAQKSFFIISSPNVASWTALINAYRHHGLDSEAILLFDRMLEENVAPNGATFVGILAACSQAGLVNEGIRYFHLMYGHYGVTPTLEHYACMVELLGRSGYLKEAEDFIKVMPIKPDAVVWTALLSSCWYRMDMEMGERVAEHMFNLEPKPSSAYVILSNIYALLGKWGEKISMRKELQDLDMKKNPGCSWIELNNRLHIFSMDSRTHPNYSLINATLKSLTANLICVFQFNISISIPENGHFDMVHD